MGGSTRKKTDKAVLNGANIRKGILKLIENHMIKHWPGIEKTMAESEQNAIVVNFASKIDGSESQTTVKTKFSYSQRVTDSLSCQMDDPNQGRLEFIDGEGNDPDKEEQPELPEDETPKKGKSKSKAKSKATPESDSEVTDHNETVV